MEVRALIAKLFEQDILITPEQVALLTSKDADEINKLIGDTKAIENYLESLNKPIETKSAIPVQIIKTHGKKPRKRTYQDFVGHYQRRFQTLERILRQRRELAGVMSIDRVKARPKEKVAIIGLILEKRETKNQHIILEVEDKTGTVSVLCSKQKEHLLSTAHDLCLDEIIGVTGMLGDGIIFADEIYIPGIPPQNELKKCPDDVNLVCISDIHFGNKNFLEREFQKFIEWLNGDSGSEEAKEAAKKIKYLIIAGDIVEGVGVYPSQEGDLSIVSIYDQYAYADAVLSKIPEHINVILIAGNHDIGRQSEPQPRLPAEFFPKLSQRDNVHFLSNPSVVKIHQTSNFPGFTCLLYHGGSFFYYGNNVMRLFREGGMSNPVGIMQYLLQRRHLAPSHTSTLFVPDPEEDALVIEEIPDFFITGHLHTTQDKLWNGITMLSCSCWVPLTEYQIKAGLLIDPGKFMLINLKTRAVQTLKPEDLD